ncbi:PREDICTED: reverse mRNAase, partial [Prunus dulcis]
VEVKEAVFQMGGMKAPGPNGFQGMFYQTYWDTILAEVQGTMKDFFEIQDNIILAHEVFHYLKLRKSKKVFEMGVKLDMNKAYDRVEWDFLEAVMIRMGFTMSWVELIISCIIT